MDRNKNQGILSFHVSITFTATGFGGSLPSFESPHAEAGPVRRTDWGNALAAA